MGAELIPAVISAVGSIFGGKKRPDPATQAAADWAKYSLGQAQQAGLTVPDVIGILAKSAGLTYTPGSPATPGTPGQHISAGGITLNRPGTPGTPATAPHLGYDPNWTPYNTPDFQNLLAQETARESDLAKRIAPVNAAANLAGQHGPGRSTGALQRGLARDQASFSRNYGAQKYSERDQKVAQLAQLIVNQANGGQGAAAMSAQIGAQNTALANQEAERQAQALAPLFAMLFKSQANNAASPTLPAGMPYNPNDPYLWSGGVPVNDPLAVDDPLIPKWNTGG